MRSAPSNLARTAPGRLPPTPVRVKDEERASRKLKYFARSLPYNIESEEEMHKRLDVIITRLAQAVESRDYEYGVLQWDSLLAAWMELKYPLPKKKRIALVKLFYQICVVPGMPADTVSACMDSLAMFSRSKKKLSIEDLRLPWRPVYKILSCDLFLRRRQFEYSQTAYNMAYVAEVSRRFFSPACIDEMLEEFIPHIIGSNLDRILANQYYLVTFLPLSHPQYYLPTMMRLWEAVNSYAFDERMLSFLSKLAELHVDPTVSDPKLIDKIPMDWGEEPRVRWPKHEINVDDWRGIYKDVGMFTDDEWNFIMCKCLVSMEIPLADAGSLTTGPSVDGQAGFEIGRLPRCAWRIASLARIIVYSMTPDSAPAPLTAFVKYIVYEFNKRWHEEMQPDCKVPKSRRLTAAMRRELVRCLRTVCLLSIFSSDSTSTGNVQSALKSMISMEPDLILPSILDRAVTALETLTETQRTIAIIKGLGAVSSGLTSRAMYYPGAKHIAPVLELLIPGIDLNDPNKTLCTSTLVKDIAQFIKFGDLTEFNFQLATSHGFSSPLQLSTTPGTSSRNSGASTPMRIHLPSFSVPTGFTGDETPNDSEPRLPDNEEDALVKESTSSFSNFITSWFHRVITLMENLPEEGQPGTRAGGEDEVAVIDNVGTTCYSICQHLSEPLFDLVLNLMHETTSSSDALPSDATLHWNLAILRGAMHKDGREILPYKEELKDILNLLVEKAYSKRGYQWASRLLYSILLSCTNTYPLEERFVNVEEWHGTAFLHSHHKYWGKMYPMGDATISWHVPNQDEIAFALEIFEDVVSPTLGRLEALLEGNATRDAAWRNDFCRFISFVQEAFSGIAGLMKQDATQEEKDVYYANTDLPQSIPEMVAWTLPIEVNYPLRDPKDPRHVKIMGYRRRFVEFLLRASRALRQQGEENTVDAIHTVISSFRTYMLENGAPDVEDWGTLRNRFGDDRNVARNYAGQQEWPRSLWILRLRFYQAARLRANNMERIRTDIENDIIDELTEWSMYIYATVRAPAQSLLARVSEVYDGVRTRVLPQIYKSLVQGTDDDRMKGALYLLNYPAFGKYAVTEPSQLPLFIKYFFGCQHNEKPSIQSVLSSIADNALSNFVERCQTVFKTDSKALLEAAEELFATVPEALRDREVIQRNIENCRKREKKFQEHLNESMTALLSIGNSSSTHWRYSIVALRMIRVLVRKDVTNNDAQLEYLVAKITDNHPSMRYYSQRAIMKMLRYIKVRSSATKPEDISLQINRNPLHRLVAINQPTLGTTEEYLHAFSKPLDWKHAVEKPLLYDKVSSGWLAWEKTSEALLASDSLLKDRLESEATPVVEALRQWAIKPTSWESIKTHYSEETQSGSVNWDNISFVKTVFQILGNEPWEAFRPTLETLLADSEQNKQRAAAEFLAGVIGGTKNWPIGSQAVLLDWLSPQLPKILGQNVKTDTLSIWTSFLEYTLGNRDPRRPFCDLIVKYLVQENQMMEYNQELSFDAVRVCSFTQAMAEAFGWRFRPWVEPILDRHWPELGSEHDEVRAYIADMLQLFDKIMWQPQPSVPTAETVVRECQAMSDLDDIFSIRRPHHHSRFKELIQQFGKWREERLPGARAIHSRYDRTAATVLKWLFLGLHDIHAVSIYEYVLPFIPELLRMSELNDNNDLASRASLLLTRTCGVSPPREMIAPILHELYKAIQDSPSWRIRLKALPLLQVFYFRQLPLLSDIKVIRILEVVCACLDDENIAVREMAATTLSGILRCSPRQSVITLKDRFQRLARRTKLPEKSDPNYATALRTLHSAMLGVGALLDAYPYSCPSWVPGLITDVLAKHTHSPLPISATVRKTAQNFKRTHQDTWAEDQKRFNEDAQSALSLLLTGSSYYA
ncbi:hypothetical protein PIIN_02692 [Serendipita indica DSM 11827]|uniref:Uncharacterized protein n=1 Tax=Serendipita indica (strain DSM 11827) TaxID=1109443 RepID=G4TC06_SERID|nr:hypothetical protein PIIN_02692 [Serendipita indica DSM 11827]